MGAATFIRNTHFDKKNTTFCRPQDDGTKVAAGEALCPCDTVWPLLTSLFQVEIELEIHPAPADTVEEGAIFMPQTTTVL